MTMQRCYALMLLTLKKAWSAVVLIIPLVEIVNSDVLFKLIFFGLDHSSNTDLDSPPNGSDIEPSLITKPKIEM